MRVWAISDLHTDYKANAVWCDKLPETTYSEDVLIVAGDVSDNLEILRHTLETLSCRWHRVFFTVGNHDLWCRNSDKNRVDSISKLAEIEALCTSLGVLTTPLLVGKESSGQGGVWVVPLLSWYQATWDKESDVEGAFPIQKMAVDLHACSWPEAGLNAGDDSLALFFDALNVAPTRPLMEYLHQRRHQEDQEDYGQDHDQETTQAGSSKSNAQRRHMHSAEAAPEEAPSTPQHLSTSDLAPPEPLDSRSEARPSSEVLCRQSDATLVPACDERRAIKSQRKAAAGPDPDAQAAPYGAQEGSQQRQSRQRRDNPLMKLPVISFSHFLPLQELLPEKRFLRHPNLAKVVGSCPLAQRLAQIRPDVHVFGHTHFAWDATIDGTRYIQWPLAYPSERSEHEDARQPLLVWDSSLAPGSKLPQNDSYWCRHYAVNERAPDNIKPAPWCRVHRQPS